MKRLKLILLFTAFVSFTVTAQQSNRKDRVAEYIKQYKNMAIQEQKRVGIPAAITLAQGIHETNAGASELAVNANNHFGIKCKKEWTGETYTYTDDRPDECFRKYNSDVQSYIDHSDYLKSGKRYESLFNLSVTNYSGWAYGLKRCGYATNPKYAQLLIKIVEENNLQEFTYIAMGKNANAIDEAEKTVVMGSGKASEVVPDEDALPAKKNQLAANGKKVIVSDGSNKYTIIKNSDKPVYGQTIIVNGLKAFYAQKDASLLQEAMKYHMRYAKLLELNDLPDTPLEADMFIYLEKKNVKGNGTYHVVKPGETMVQIAQIEGIQLKTLQLLNKLKPNEEPMAGTLLQLQKTIDQKPQIIAKKKPAKEEEAEFLDHDARPAPQGTAKMNAGYISKDEIEEAKEQDILAERREQRAVDTKLKTEEEKVEDIKQALAKEEITTDPEVKPIETPKEISAEPIKEEQPLTASITNAQVATTNEVPTPTTGDSDEEIIVKNSSVVQNTTPPITTESVNIAENKAVEEQTPEPVKEEPKVEEPKDEFDRLKARLDKAVYATENTTSTKKEDAPKPVGNSKPVFYTVKKGDNAFGIAKKHNITMGQLKEWNKLDFGEIKVGTKLRVK